MRLSAKGVREVLARRGVDALYHANTVTTACTFLSQDALLSRGNVEDQGLQQTPQASDSIDKKRRIWRDVFLDAVDIHARINRRNYYGPILFVLDLDLLIRTPVETVWVTKKNPTEWISREPRSHRFFRSLEEFEQTYMLGDFGSMLMLRDTGGQLTLHGNTRRIIVDDPGPLTLTSSQIDVFPPAMKALRRSAQAGGLRYLRIQRRDCKEWCGCHDQYRTYPFDTRRWF